jgi:hypothetical protein
MADEKAAAKDDSYDLPNVGSPTKVEVKGVTKNAGQPLAAATATDESASDPQAPAPASEYSLKKIDEDDVPTPGLVTLEVVAEGAFESSTGEYLKTGDRKTVSRTEAQALLGLKVNGADAFKEV